MGELRDRHFPRPILTKKKQRRRNGGHHASSKRKHFRVMYCTIGYIIHEAFRLCGRAVVQQFRMAVIGWRDLEGVGEVNNAYTETSPKFLERYRKLFLELRVSLRLLCNDLKTVIPISKMIDSVVSSCKMQPLGVTEC